MQTIYDHFADRATENHARVAVHWRGEDVSYGQLAAEAASLAGWLEDSGVKAGDRVVVLLKNSPRYVVSYLAILRCRAIVVALNPDITARELATVLENAAPTVLIAGGKALRAFTNVPDEQAGSVRRLVIEGDQAAESSSIDTIDFSDTLSPGNPPSGPLPTADDLAQIIYTSGTTGNPKGVTLTHKNLATNCRSIVEYLKLTSEDRVLVTLPFFYSYGNSLLFTHLAVGGRLVLASDFVFWNRALDLMQEHHVTGFSGVPSSYAMLLHKSDFARRSFEHLRYITCAGGGLAPAVVRQLTEALPDIEIFLMYGQTEATARLSTLMPDELDNKLGSIGTGIPGVHLEVVDPQGRPVAVGETGEIVARGENVMVGYWRNQDATAAVLRDGRLWTGDLARVDEDGYIYIVGRRSDIIKSGAYRINPKEIEEILLELESVAETAVVGLPDEILGESPVAFVVPAHGDARPDDILEYCRGALPRYKMIQEVRFVETLPKTSSGKIRRRELLTSDKSAR